VQKSWLIGRHHTTAAAVVLFAGVLLVGGVARVLDATRRFWKS